MEKIIPQLHDSLKRLSRGINDFILTDVGKDWQSTDRRRKRITVLLKLAGEYKKDCFNLSGPLVFMELRRSEGRLEGRTVGASAK